MPTALIVEDEPDANRLLAMLVQLRGYETVSAFTGEEALEKVESRHPDIVFLDLMLPDINGYDVCRSLKARKETSLIPVIMVTARVAAENRIESFGVGADDYVAKPYTPDQIFHAMASASAWCRRLGGQTIEGLIALDPAAEDATQQLIARLRNILVARTTLDLDAIERIGASLREILRDCLGWARRMRQPVDSVLGFVIHADRLAITLRDSSGWLAHNHADAVLHWPATFTAAAFDQVLIEEPGRRMTFHKWYQPSDRPPST